MTRRALSSTRAAWGVSPTGDLSCASRRGAGSAGLLACRSGDGERRGEAMRARKFEYRKLVARESAPVRFGPGGGSGVRVRGASRPMGAADPAAPRSK